MTSHTSDITPSSVVKYLKKQIGGDLFAQGKYFLVWHIFSPYSNLGFKMCQTRKLLPCARKLRLICLVWVTAVTLLLLLNDGCKLESLQDDGRTEQEIPQTPGTVAHKARACFVVSLL